MIDYTLLRKEDLYVGRFDCGSLDLLMARGDTINVQVSGMLNWKRRTRLVA